MISFFILLFQWSFSIICFMRICLSFFELINLFLFFNLFATRIVGILCLRKQLFHIFIGCFFFVCICVFHILSFFPGFNSVLDNDQTGSKICNVINLIWSSWYDGLFMGPFLATTSAHNMDGWEQFWGQRCMFCTKRERDFLAISCQEFDELWPHF